MEEYTDEKISEYFKDYAIDSNNTDNPRRVAKYDRDTGNLRVFVFNIKDDKYSEFLSKLVDFGFKGKLDFVCYRDNEKEHDLFDRFLQYLKDYESDIGIENICLSGNFEFAESDFFKKVQTILVSEFSFNSINKIVGKFPNLKSIELPNDLYGGPEYSIDLENLMTLLKYVSNLKIETKNSTQEIQEAINQNEDLRGKILILNNGNSFVNIDNLREGSKSVTIGLDDITTKSHIIERFKNEGCEIIVSVPDVSMLSAEQAEKLIPIAKKIEVDSYNERRSNTGNYDIDTYIAVRTKLDELVEGIDINLPEKEKLAEVYYRIGKNIVYDHKALLENANTAEEKEYVERVQTTCRNLENGLLYGKCVCAGYAEILRNALALLDVENICVSGSTPGGMHAWNKVKLDGMWYNVDATWDAPSIAKGTMPHDFCKSDKYIEKVDKKEKLEGQNFDDYKCETDMPTKEMRSLFKEKGLTETTIMDSLKRIKETVKKTVSKQIESLKRRFTSRKLDLLPDVNPQPAQKDNSQEEKRNSWDLENFGINKEEINKKIQEVNRKENESHHISKAEKNVDQER